MTIEIVSVKEALELKSGGIYALQLEEHVPMEQLELISKAVRTMGDTLGIKFVFLTKGLRLIQPPDVMKPEEKDEKSPQGGL
jgi:hypothetical protein